MKPKLIVSAALVAGVAFTASLTYAGEMIYRPINPSFGGDPLVGNYLLGKAQAQDDNTDPNAPDFGGFSETDLFLQNLEANLVERAINDAVNGEPGRTSEIESSNLRIRVRSLGGGGFVMNILDRTTGEQTTVNLGQPTGQF
ncbi:curli assembly protein CsgF [Halomonas marinisediminis]|uniref:Curli production assembly/transport component CsgF n=1 Tax=Halomonas marinisediminis TaxID=2546095 RepID=A0ABY2D7Q4_9GAMM|nr:curli assembly protein CsgF [Halomonas marinisediminis]TDB02885.1 curli production assembly/transport protein CsgF [Halomonas marinisediminis]